MRKKTWLESHQDCSEKSAQLLAQDSWSTLIVPVRSRGAVVPQEGGAGQSPMGPAAAESVGCQGDEPPFPSWQCEGRTASPGDPGHLVSVGHEAVG